MKHLYASLLILAITVQGSTQSMNMVLQDNWDDNTLPSSSSGVVYNDCWGYNASNGTEVAILGAWQRIYFFDVTNPNDPQVIDYFTVQNSNGSTNSSVWRDFKTYGQYCYAAADQGTSGLMIFDLQYVPDSVVLVTQTQEFFTRAHNIWIDVDQGRLYTAGGSNGTGTTILDIATDPTDPVEIGSPVLPLGYIHDIHVINHIGYASHGNDQALAIFDFDDPDVPLLLATHDSYPESGYNHSACIDATGTKLIFADETHGKGLKLVNPNLQDPQTTNYHVFRSQLLENNSNSIGHNPFIKDDLCFVAYYHDGVQVFDISDTNDIERVAYYDTYTNTNYNGYEGCWGVYPYLESGNIIASDVSNGLFMMSLSLGVLPLEFIAFDALAENNDIALTWKVAGPMDGERFIIEYSRNGVIYDMINESNAVVNQHSYSFKHSDPGPGTHYYRIKMKLRDGDQTSTDVQVVRLGQDTPFILKTTFANDHLIADLDEAGEVFMFTADGKMVQSEKVSTSGRQEINVTNLPSGQYFIAFVSGTGEYSGAFVKP